MKRSYNKKIYKRDQSEFDHKFSCWANNHNGWSKCKKLNRKMARKRIKRLIGDE